MKNGPKSQKKPAQGLFPRTEHWQGLLICILIAVLATLSNLYLYNKISALLWALVYSILLANLIKLPQLVYAGASYAAGPLLRFAIAVLGLTISALAWAKMGIVGLAEVLIVILFALVLGFWLARRMKLEVSTGALIAGGTAICGATAIAALAPALKAKEEEIGVAIACVTLFGLVAMTVYPILFNATVVGDLLHHSEIAFGVWAGTGIHETAQVVGAAAQVSEKAVQMGLVTKSVRIFAIAPVVLILSLMYGGRQKTGTRSSAAIPFFAVIFVIFTLLNSLLLYLPYSADSWAGFTSGYLKPVLNILLAVAFAGVGFKVRFKSFASIGWKAVLTGFTVSTLTAVLALILVVLLYMPANGI